MNISNKYVRQNLLIHSCTFIEDNINTSTTYRISQDWNFFEVLQLHFWQCKYICLCVQPLLTQFSESWHYLSVPFHVAIFQKELTQTTTEFGVEAHQKLDILKSKFDSGQLLDRRQCSIHQLLVGLQRKKC